MKELVLSIGRVVLSDTERIGNDVISTMVSEWGSHLNETDKKMLKEAYEHYKVAGERIDLTLPSDRRSSRMVIRLKNGLRSNSTTTQRYLWSESIVPFFAPFILSFDQESFNEFIEIEQQIRLAYNKTYFTRKEIIEELQYMVKNRYQNKEYLTIVALVKINCERYSIEEIYSKRFIERSQVNDSITPEIISEFVKSDEFEYYETEPENVTLFDIKVLDLI